jgi:hypothetical protein
MDVLVIDDASTDHTPSLLSIEQGWLRSERIERDGGYQWNPAPVFALGHRLARGDVHLEQGGEVVHVTNCGHILSHACRPGLMAFATVYAGSEEELRLVEAAADRGDLPFGPDLIVPPDAPLEMDGGKAPIPRVPVGSREIALYCGRSRPVPFMFLGAIHREDWESLGGYDATIPMGADQDLAIRFRARGGTCVWISNAIAFHLAHGKS